MQYVKDECAQIILTNTDFEWLRRIAFLAGFIGTYP